ncbi:FadR/GntR family transcriptional regulator [Nonomuraea sp. NPDC050310]|uniref:FadR/GntR family transcriptional regulator n=1 Tax=Nonomuraea sp. NPDC050310 TaxID=3154935 RepID=UPI0033EF3828
MADSWAPVKRTRTFEEVLAQIERRIAEDGLRIGDRLPGERQLAEQLQVSRSSVREALRVLETLGVLSSQVGRGPEAGAVLISRPGAALTDLLRLHVGLDGLEPAELIETRLMIERFAAERAALRGPDTSALSEALAAMDAASGPEEFVEHDIAFHCAIADASGNRLIAVIMRSLRDSVRPHAVQAVERIGDTAGLRADHQRILDAISAGDPAEAARAVTDHLAKTYPPGPAPA